MQPATGYYKHRMWIDRGDRTTKIKLDEINQFAAEMDHMAQAVRDGFEPKTPGEEGLRDVRIMRAIYEAAETGRPVHLDWPRMAQD